MLFLHFINSIKHKLIFAKHHVSAENFDLFLFHAWNEHNTEELTQNNQLLNSFMSLTKQ